MTANNSIDPARFLSEHLEHAEPDVLRSMLVTFVEASMGAQKRHGRPAPAPVTAMEVIQGLKARRRRSVPPAVPEPPSRGLQLGPGNRLETIGIRCCHETRRQRGRQPVCVCGPGNPRGRSARHASMRMFALVLVPKTTAQRVPLGDAGGSPIADHLARQGCAGLSELRHGRNHEIRVRRRSGTGRSAPGSSAAGREDRDFLLGGGVPVGRPAAARRGATDVGGSRRAAARHRGDDARDDHSVAHCRGRGGPG